MATTRRTHSGRPVQTTAPCPTCGTQTRITGETLTCPNGHTFPRPDQSEAAQS